MQYTVTTQPMLSSLPDITNLSTPTPDVAKFFHIADYFHNIETQQIEEAPATSFKTYHIWFPIGFQPLSVDMTRQCLDPPKYVRMCFWYQAIKLLRMELMQAVSNTFQLIWDDAQTIIQTQENCVFCLIHTNRDIPQHIHPPTRVDMPSYTLSYCVQVNPRQHSNLAIDIAGDVIPVFPPNVVLSRFAFNSELHYHGTLNGDNSSNMYLWFVFDGITAFKDNFEHPTDETHRVTYWKSA